MITPAQALLGAKLMNCHARSPLKFWEILRGVVIFEIRNLGNCNPSLSGTSGPETKMFMKELQLPLIIDKQSFCCN